MEALLHQPVLVLNRLWQAVNICSARRALTMLFEGNAQVVHSEDGDFNTFGFHQWADLSEAEPDTESIHGVSLKLRLPRVILLLVYDRVPRKEVKFTRHNIFQRDKNTCQYCGKKNEAR
ncbi:MAG: HNH endonuclease, partial [Verrucomicrobiota bacterium]|nr:HNH endonuclease [Verrucomicrobiota bacterium]